MNDSKLSMPRRPVSGSRRSSGSGKRIADAASARRETPNANSCGNRVVGDAHLVAIGVGAERQQRRVLRLPAEPADAARRRSPRRSTIAARPLTPSRLRSNGSSSASSVSSGIASTRPGAEQRDRRAPRDHVHVVGHLRLAAVRRDREHVDQRVAAPRFRPLELRRLPRGSRRALRAITPAPPIAGTLWHTAQLVPLNAGPSPSSAVSTSVKSSSPRRNSLNSTGVMPGSGSPGRSRLRLRAGCDRAAASARPPDGQTASAASLP